MHDRCAVPRNDGSKGEAPTFLGTRTLTFVGICLGIPIPRRTRSYLAETAALVQGYKH